MPDNTEIEQYFKDNDIDINNLKNIPYLLQKNTDTLKGGLRSSNVKQLRSVYVINAQDSLDDTYPMYLHLNIVEEMVKIVSIRLSFWLLPFRAYSTTDEEQEAVTSGSGGSQTSSSGGGQTSSSSGSHTHTLGRTTLDTGTTDAHVHTYGATNEISSEASNHTHTVANHTHTVVDHTHSVPAHTHGLTFGIHEEDNSPTISFQISRDNGETYGNVLGTYTADVSNLEIKDYIVASGSYIIKFTSSARARISAQLTIKLDITAR